MKKIISVVLCLTLLLANTSTIFANTQIDMQEGGNVEFEILENTDDALGVKFIYDTGAVEFLYFDFSNPNYIGTKAYNGKFELVKQNQIVIPDSMNQSINSSINEWMGRITTSI